MRKHWTHFVYIGNHEFIIYLEHAEMAAVCGQVDTVVSCMVNLPYIRQQLDFITDDELVEHLQDYGAWEERELRHREENEKRALWIAAGDIVEQQEEQE